MEFRNGYKPTSYGPLDKVISVSASCPNATKHPCRSCKPTLEIEQRVKGYLAAMGF